MVVPGAVEGVSVLCGRSERFQRRGPDGSCCPVRIVAPSGLHTWTDCFVNRTVQSSSQSFPIPKKECWKPVMVWASVTGRSRLRWNEAEDAWI